MGEPCFHGSDFLFDAKYTLRSGIGGVTVGEMRPLKKRAPVGCRTPQLCSHCKVGVSFARTQF